MGIKGTNGTQTKPRNITVTSGGGSTDPGKGIKSPKKGGAPAPTAGALTSTLPMTSNLSQFTGQTLQSNFR